MRPTLAFQSTLPGWGATRQTEIHAQALQNFNPRSPDGERPAVPSRSGPKLLISIHAPRMGSDGRRRCCVRFMYIFQSTLPGWGATTSRTSSSTPSAGFQSTLPGWGATVVDLAGIVAMEFQSTLPGWGATMGASTGVSRDLFQSTLPGWGATISRTVATTSSFYFNPRSPDGERLMREWIEPPDVISIHAPRMGSDCPVDDADAIRQAFQSTLPGWGATARWPSNTPCVTNFNPRSPDGERPKPSWRASPRDLFQSTLPGWGATLRWLMLHR